MIQRTPHNASVTLIFNPEDPWNKSTKYTIKVVAGVSSVYQEILEKESLFEFSTPTIQVISPFPVNNIHLPLPTNVILLLRFDQRIEQEEAVKLIKFKVGGILTGSLVPAYMPARVATPKEIETDNSIKFFTKGYEEKFLAFTPIRPFPNNEEVTVFFGPNVFIINL